MKYYWTRAEILQETNSFPSCSRSVLFCAAVSYQPPNRWKPSSGILGINAREGDVVENILEYIQDTNPTSHWTWNISAPSNLCIDEVSQGVIPPPAQRSAGESLQTDCVIPTCTVSFM